jgi:tetratricopeptide (TPR) repeat protein
MKRLLLGLTVLFTINPVTAQEILNKAKNALSNRDTAAAFSGFQDAVKAGQRVGEANYYLGAISLAQHRVDDAITFLQASVRSDDERVDAQKLLGDAYMMRKDVTSALERYRIASKLAPKNPEIAVAHGLALLGVDSTDAAIIHLIRAREYAPTNPAIYAALGDAYVRQRVYALGFSNYQQAIELDPKNIATRMKLGEAYEMNRQYTDAVTAYDGVTKVDSNYAEAYLRIGRIYIKAVGVQKRLAVAPMKKYVQLNPKSVEGWQLYARALFEAEDYAEAVKISQEALKRDSTAIDMWRIEAHSLVFTREYKSALNAFQVLERHQAIKPEDYSLWARAYFYTGQEDKALDIYYKAIAADSTNCDPYFDLGTIIMKKGNYEQAAAMFERKISCDPRSLSSYVNAAACYMQGANKARARELLLKAIELKPDFFQARLWLARYYVAVDTFDLAEQAYLDVLKLIGDQTDKYKKEYGEANSLLGSLYMTKGYYERAISAFMKALSVGYENANMRLSLGQAILQTLSTDDPPEVSRKKNEDALKNFRRCIELDPNNGQGHFWLGAGLIRLRVPGEDEINRKLTEEACNEFRKSLKLDPKNESAKKQLEQFCP